MEFYGRPPIGQKQGRPMDGAQFHPSRVGEAGGKLIRNKVVSSTKQRHRHGVLRTPTHRTKTRTSDGWGTVSSLAGRRSRRMADKKQSCKFDKTKTSAWSSTDSSHPSDKNKGVRWMGH